jgi:hypothetical protein
MAIYAAITSTVALVGVVLILWLIRENNTITDENIRRINKTFDLMADKCEIDKEKYDEQ